MTDDTTTDDDADAQPPADGYDVTATANTPSTGGIDGQDTLRASLGRVSLVLGGEYQDVGALNVLVTEGEAYLNLTGDEPTLNLTIESGVAVDEDDWQAGETVDGDPIPTTIQLKDEFGLK